MHIGGVNGGNGKGAACDGGSDGQCAGVNIVKGNGVSGALESGHTYDGDSVGT